MEKNKDKWDVARCGCGNPLYPFARGDGFFYGCALKGCKGFAQAAYDAVRHCTCGSIPNHIKLGERCPLCAKIRATSPIGLTNGGFNAAIRGEKSDGLQTHVNVKKAQKAVDDIALEAARKSIQDEIESTNPFHEIDKKMLHTVDGLMRKPGMAVTHEVIYNAIKNSGIELPHFTPLDAAEQYKFLLQENERLSLLAEELEDIRRQR